MCIRDSTGARGGGRFLVCHDYGMGQLWWWVRAPSARAVVEAVAEVEVVDDPDTARCARGWNLAEVGLDDPHPNPLTSLRRQRDEQRSRPGFGALAGRGRVWLREVWDEEEGEPVVFFVELGPDGRRLRQVEVAADGTGVRTGPRDWSFDPPVDLWDPDLAARRATRQEFEAAWERARQA
ncbi:hypothetical protein [Streptomyces fragilis]|uniref:hypothetical protein n=1 Tax=Streptomyces fragilis TaxID=67301 RepID=UPI0024DED5D0|nr:hypothetical protein [Streptomyces fragilis]